MQVSLFLLLLLLFYVRFSFVVRLSYNFITSSQIIAESSIIIAKYFLFSQLHVAGFQRYFFSYASCFLHSHRHLLFFQYWSELHILPSYLHLHSHNLCFVNFFNSFILVIMLKTLRLKSSVLFGTQILWYKSFKVLQLPTHLSNLTANE